MIAAWGGVGEIKHDCKWRWSLGRAFILGRAGASHLGGTGGKDKHYSEQK